MKKIMVVISSVRKQRRADLIMPLIEAELDKLDDVTVDIADLRETVLPFFNETTPPTYNEGNYENAEAAQWAKRVEAADGFIFLVAEYNHSFTAPLKNAIDWVGKPWNNKPVAFVSYGGVSGGTRAVQQLRQVVLELFMFPLHTATHLPYISNQFDEHGNPTDPKTVDHIAGTIAELNTFITKVSPAF